MADESHLRDAEHAAGRAALMNPWVFISGIVVLVMFALMLALGAALAGASGSGGNDDESGNGGGGGAGEVDESGQKLRQAFLDQKNITYQKTIIPTEIRDGGVVDNVLRAILAAAREKGIGNISISAAGCRSHSDTGGLHCPTTPAQAMDIGSVGTDNPEKINAKICKDFNDGNPYQIEQLGGITSSSKCIILGGSAGAGQFDSTDHVHVGVSK